MVRFVSRASVYVYFSVLTIFFVLEVNDGTYLLLYPLKLTETIISFKEFIRFLGLLLWFLVPIFTFLIIEKGKLPKIFKYFAGGVVAFASSIIIHLYGFLLIFYLFYRITFDFSFYWLNQSDAFLTIFRIYPISLVFLIFSIVIFTIIWYIGFKNITHSLQKNTSLLGITILLFIVGLIVTLLTPINAQGQLVQFIHGSFMANRPIADYYNTYYQKTIKGAINNKTLPVSINENSLLGSNLFILHLESVNALIADEQATPNLHEIAKQGIYFPKFYSSAVQTIRAEETILCGLPPALGPSLVNQLSITELEQLPCLPRLLNQLGYKTLFFKDDSLEFAQTGKFMKAIGFSEIHQSDIMQIGDPELDWGYREDIFLNRVEDYLKNYPKEKLFVYIALSATNHVPFVLQDERYRDKVPYPQPISFEQKYSNTTFIQDAYTKSFIDNYTTNYEQNSTLIIIPDHSWPIPIHNNNRNDIGAFEENFLTPLAWIPPKAQSEKFALGNIINTRWSELDILPTIISLLTNKPTNNYLGESFSNLLIDNNSGLLPQKNKLSAQPYSGGLISVVKFPRKIIFDLTKNKVWGYDLDKDSQEKNPLDLGDPKNYLNIIDAYFKTD